MIRLVVAACLAVSVHLGLFWMDLPQSRPKLIVPQSRTVSIDLVSVQKSVDEPSPSKLENRKTRTNHVSVKKPSAPLQPLPQPINRPALPATKAAVPATKEDVGSPEPKSEPTPIAPEKNDSDPVDDRAAIQASVPRYDLNPPPHYPRLARRRNYQGIVLLDVRVTVDGKVAEVRIAESSGHSILDRSAVKSVKEWHFEPAKQINQPVEMWVQVPVRYKLQ